jgi:predicted ATPase
MRTLERITVTGYKSIRELRDFELGDINVLIGANGVGKSNFLSFFELLRALANNRLQLYVSQNGGPNYLLHFGGKHTKEILIGLTIGNGSIEVFEYRFRLRQAISGEMTFSGEMTLENEQCLDRLRREEIQNWVSLGSGHKETKLSPQESWWQGAVLDRLQKLRVYHFQDTTPEARVKQNPDIYDNHELKSGAANLASFLYLLKNHHLIHYKRILSTVRLAAPFFDDFFLQPMPEDKQRIRLRWRHINSDDDWDISQLSDGTLRFICLTTLLLQPNPPSLIIIDEPELGLHPYAMGLLVEMLRSVATHSQVIISTQSTALVSQFFPEEVVVVDQEKDASVFRRLNSEELKVWLEDYSLGEIWEMNLVGGRPRR